MTEVLDFLGTYNQNRETIIQALERSEVVEEAAIALLAKMDAEMIYNVEIAAEVEALRQALYSGQQ